MFAASEARLVGYGGIAAVARATGIAASTIDRGLKELASGDAFEREGVRRPGGGRTKLSVPDPALLPDLLSLVEPTERGDPMSGLRWTCASTRRLADALVCMGHKVCHETVRTLLRQENFSLQANRKTLEGSNHPDRDAQFRHIAKSVSGAMRSPWPDGMRPRPMWLWT